jgi:hypothetical protein
MDKISPTTAKGSAKRFRTMKETVKARDKGKKL